MLQLITQYGSTPHVIALYGGMNGTQGHHVVMHRPKIIRYYRYRISGLQKQFEPFS